MPPGSGPAALLETLSARTAADGVLVDGIVGCARIRSWVGALQAGLLAEFAHRRPDHSGQRDEQVSEFAADGIGCALQAAHRTAGHRVGFARGLAALPGTFAALSGGRIGLGVAHTLAAADPAAAGPAAARRRHVRAVADRSVTLYPDRDEMAGLWALLPADDAVQVRDALHRRSWGSPAPLQGLGTGQRPPMVRLLFRIPLRAGVVGWAAAAGLLSRVASFVECGV